MTPTGDPVARGGFNSSLLTPARFGAACGFAWFVLVVAAFAVLSASHGLPSTARPSPDEIVSTYTQEVAPAAWVGLLLDMLGGLLFVFFAAAFWALLSRVEDAPAWLSAATLGAGLLYVAAKVPQWAALDSLLSGSGQHMDRAALVSLWNLYQGVFAVSRAPFALFLVTGALVVVMHGGLPKWLGWVALPLAALMLVTVVIPSAAPLQQLAGLWVLVVGAYMFRRAS